MSSGKHVSIFCSFWRAVLNEKIWYLGKTRKNYFIFCSKVFTPRLLMHDFSSGASVSVWTFCYSCIWVPQLSSVWKDGSQNHTVIVGKSSNKQKCWQTKGFLWPEGFFWRTADSLTVQDKQGTHEQLSLNKHTAVDHSDNNTVLRIKGM